MVKFSKRREVKKQSAREVFFVGRPPEIVWPWFVVFFGSALCVFPRRFVFVYADRDRFVTWAVTRAFDRLRRQGAALQVVNIYPWPSEAPLGPRNRPTPITIEQHKHKQSPHVQPAVLVEVYVRVRGRN